MSDCGPTASPRACSGERYWAVPTIEPTSVICWVFAARAMPKSVTFSRPSSVSTMLWGLMSRWITPWRWAASSAASAWVA